MNRRSTIALALGFVVPQVGCSSSYIPARSPRIAMVQDGGSPALVKDGKTYSVGIFGGGLMDAVEGNPVAEEHAAAFRNLSIAGWSLYAAGFASEFAGIYVVAANRDGTNSSSDSAGAALVIGGLGALVTSLVLLMNAYPHVYDAVNIYNDGVDASLGFPPRPAPFGFVGAPRPWTPAPAKTAPAPAAPSAAPAAPAATPSLAPSTPPTTLPSAVPSSAPSRAFPE